MFLFKINYGKLYAQTLAGKTKKLRAGAKRVAFSLLGAEAHDLTLLQSHLLLLTLLCNPKETSVPLPHTSVQTIHSERNQCLVKCNFCPMVWCIGVHVVSSPGVWCIFEGVVGGFVQNRGGLPCIGHQQGHNGSAKR